MSFRVAICCLILLPTISMTNIQRNMLEDSCFTFASSAYLLSIVKHGFFDSKRMININDQLLTLKRQWRTVPCFFDQQEVSMHYRLTNPRDIIGTVLVEELGAVPKDITCTEKYDEYMANFRVAVLIKALAAIPENATSLDMSCYDVDWYSDADLATAFATIPKNLNIMNIAHHENSKKPKIQASSQVPTIDEAEFFGMTKLYNNASPSATNLGYLPSLAQLTSVYHLETLETFKNNRALSLPTSPIAGVSSNLAAHGIYREISAHSFPAALNNKKRTFSQL